MELRYWALIVLLALGWGSSFFFNEILLRELGPLTVALGRVGFGALGCWIWLFLRPGGYRVPRRALLLLGVFGFFQYAFPLSLYPVTQQWITSSMAGIVNAMTPIMVALVAHFWPGGERVTGPKVLGILLGFVGIVILVSPEFSGGATSSPWAVIATMAAPLSYGISMSLSRTFDGIDRTAMTGWSLLFGTVMLAPVALGAEGAPVITRLETWAALLIIGFVLTSAAFVLLFWLLPRVGGITASTITLLAPVSAVLLGVLVLNEPFGWAQLAGMAVIFSGLLFVDGRLFRRWTENQPKG